ncbi:hypothetical protein CAPTEDRAFT_211630 [Capitella teleta]|uniref:Trafficking protein particle complex subunit 13 n=1 Tax=Capitella teleta TaxID=283909 RepID=R7UFA0_CAPTE|nr:hypothetical protein CAPTEDRAFT_211630 [Capitella teleta]|eukprot:ELU05219.1 hypothetical protein CAPTEDRAFT_211630 [Capitella teleta]
MESKEKEHLLVLKVMRLTKPALMISKPLSCIPTHRTVDDHGQPVKVATDLAIAEGLEHFALSQLLTLPQNFGNIFLGETFSSYISVHNNSSHVCRDIQIKADLQTSSQRLTLSSSHANPVQQLTPSESIDDVIQHEVKELGTHILVCAVTYVSNTGEKMYFRKFFKFQVLKPLDVKTKFYNAESDEVYLEAQIQNITPGPIFLEKVLLDPSSHYSGIQLHTQEDPVNRPVFGKVNCVSPLDVRQYLYCLTPKPEVLADPKFMKGVTNIGKLDIVWKTNMAEKGRLQTSALQRVLPGYGDIRLMVEKISESVPVETKFNIEIRVTNCSERTMDLSVHLDNNIQIGLLWSCCSGIQIGRLTSGSSTLLKLALIPTACGLQTISGLRLTDTFLKRTYEHDEVAQVYVYVPFSDECSSPPVISPLEA